MGQTTPNISIYIPAAGETNYDASFSTGMVNIDQHDHSGGPTKGVPIATSGLADGSVTYSKLNANVVDTSSGVQVSGTNPNQIQGAPIVKSLFQASGGTGFLFLNGTTISLPTQIQLSSQPKFLANLTGDLTNVTGDSSGFVKITFNNTLTNAGSNFSTSNNQFVAPINGSYSFSGEIFMTNLGAGHTSGALQLVTTANTYLIDTGNVGANRDASNNLSVNFAISGVPMSATDTAYVTIQVYNSTKTVGILSSNANGIGTIFSGFLMV